MGIFRFRLSHSSYWALQTGDLCGIPYLCGLKIMSTMKKTGLFLFFICIGLAGITRAQQATTPVVKIAYINAQELLDAMPESDTAKGKLQKLAQDLQDMYDQYVQEYQDAVNALQSDTLSEVARESKSQDAQYLQQRLQQYQDDAQKKLDDKRTGLYQPIIDKATAAIKEVAKEHGYTYVIDNSSEVLIMAPDGDDIMNLVKAKLGITK